MINVNENELINARLKKEYESRTESFLKVWSEAFEKIPPFRMNEFGIIDTQKYDTDNGILFIGRETNDWDDKDYKKGYMFRDWMQDITQKGLADRGHITTHPNMWYNIGRWTMLLTEPHRSITNIADAKSEAIATIGKIAFTNVNKVRGENASRKEYFKLANEPIVKELLKREIEIINPKIIVCCGTEETVVPLLDNFTGESYKMHHPGARKSKTGMLEELNKQMQTQKKGHTY